MKITQIANNKIGKIFKKIQIPKKQCRKTKKQFRKTKKQFRKILQGGIIEIYIDRTYLILI